MAYSVLDDFEDGDIADLHFGDGRHVTVRVDRGAEWIRGDDQ